MTFDTELWPFITAKYFTIPPTPRIVDLIVIHTAEVAEGPTSAENLARYFATMPDGRQASAHICVDSDSIVQCVHDKDIAWAAPGANHNGIQIELCSTLNQDKAGWRDRFSLCTLALGADAAAQYCLKYNIPPIHLSDDQLRSNMRGLVGHDQVTRVWKKSDHTDPGPNFPWIRFMLTVKGAYEDRRI